MHSTARKLRHAIDSGQPVLGTFLVEFSEPAAVHVLADAGFDFVLIDCEHGNHDSRAVEALVEAGRSASICVLVRPPTAERDLVTRILDAGAGGVLVPAVDSVEQAQRAVRATKYYPVGKRGVHLLRAHTRHQPVDAATFLAEANSDLLTLIQIELEAAVGLADEIASLEGVDGLYVGPGDLSVDLGVPGQWDAPVMQEALATVARACRKYGKIMGCHVDTYEDIPRLRQQGVRMFGYSCDIGIFRTAAADAGTRFRTVLGAL